MSFTPKLEWDQSGQRKYETGVRKMALYLKNDDGTYANGVAWNGVISVQESPSGAESNPIYADDMKYLDIRSAEEFGATVQAYTYPPEFEQCDGSAAVIDTVPFITVGQQSRRAFGLAYTTRVGNDVKMNDYSYKLHIVYGCTASPSEREFQTVNDNPEAITFSWEMTTTPIELPSTLGSGTLKPTAQLTIDVSQIAAMTAGAEKTHWLECIEALEKKLYGVKAGDGQQASEPQLVMPEDIPAMFPAFVAG